ncbi:gliding motility-associated C-terminal domain-containing protein [Muriicola sp. Z0-33]|uniref:T9SS type B sorting domain-containing protein n=1 Tax=Muriicola sp. Z0-33 TaxID=2816957 RepID=UPI00223836D7|nr:gliding motility-associated C-terminal domain-containing protein [Muriicola sp. Z0-33]MCW5517614.1 gliding motility-associated C-terminal domain-containing protein [Muriicola sp. Z0-33]
MKKSIFYLFIFIGLQLYGQEAIHNFGTIRIHNDAMVGFHLDLINDGTFDQNMGLVGFYNDFVQLKVSGSFAPVFYDAEVIVENGLVLETSIGVNNNGNLISGDILTPRNESTVYSNFFDNSFYTGESSVSKVDGYAAFTNKDEFVFPVGDENRLRPLTITSMATNPLVKCAYFFENPNNSKLLDAVFNTDKKASEYISVSDKEFWRLEGDVPSNVTLTWDDYSNIPALGDYISDLKVVGWSKADNQWVNLGNTDVTGGLAYGSVTSDVFVPNDYEIITIGGNDDSLETFDTLELDNYYMTPNGDGQNDVLVIDGVERSNSNSLQIFNRYGVLVYTKKNYSNDFDGHSNRDNAIKRSSGLESGIYFYIITFNDLQQKHQGYVYISN